MKRACILFMFLVLIPALLQAAPVITSVSGTWTHGSDITITNGSGFGSKSPVAPVLWETFDDGTNGQSIASKEGWYSYSGNGARYNNTQPYSGTLSAYNYTEYGDRKGFDTSYYALPSQTAGRLYVSCMFRHDGTSYDGDDGTRVPKNWRINTSYSNHYTGPGEMALSDKYIYYYSGNTAHWSNYDDNGTGRYFTAPEYGSSTWTRHEGYLRYSDPPGSSNGYMWAAVGTQQKTFANLINRPEGWDYQPSEYLLGLMHDHGSHQLGDYHHMWVDDVYIDNTLARIEIGNASTWAACTKKVVQIPKTTWSDTSVTFTVNRGDFGTTDTAYLYVVDSTGTANSSGYEITFGEESSSPAPPTISNVTISNGRVQ